MPVRCATLASLAGQHLCRPYPRCAQHPPLSAHPQPTRLPLPQLLTRRGAPRPLQYCGRQSQTAESRGPRRVATRCHCPPSAAAVPIGQHAGHASPPSGDVRAQPAGQSPSANAVHSAVATHAVASPPRPRADRRGRQRPLPQAGRRVANTASRARALAPTVLRSPAQSRRPAAGREPYRELGCRKPQALLRRVQLRRSGCTLRVRAHRARRPSVRSL
mmetsp:Transcript_6328/g.20960  ORF Transcript_6328/g.20960 Transcript_6328/m.20960 type:complete len:218 (-) Transcript_6328:49-702(-)